MTTQDSKHGHNDRDKTQAELVQRQDSKRGHNDRQNSNVGILTVTRLKLNQYRDKTQTWAY